MVGYVARHNLSVWTYAVKQGLHVPRHPSSSGSTLSLCPSQTGFSSKPNSAWGLPSRKLLLSANGQMYAKLWGIHLCAKCRSKWHCTKPFWTRPLEALAELLLNSQPSLWVLELERRPHVVYKWRPNNQNWESVFASLLLELPNNRLLCCTSNCYYRLLWVYIL